MAFSLARHYSDTSCPITTSEKSNETSRHDELRSLSSRKFYRLGSEIFTDKVVFTLFYGIKTNKTVVGGTKVCLAMICIFFFNIAVLISFLFYEIFI